ncbi:WD40/YVTN repeat-like-containing domain superfamily protein [Pleurotus pulmonarius]
MAELGTSMHRALSLASKIQIPSSELPFKAIAFFPWETQDLAALWEGEYNKEEYTDVWNSAISGYKSSFAVASESRACILSSQSPASKLLDLRLPKVQYTGGGTPQIAWALYPSFSPLLLIAVDRRVLVLDTKTQSVVGKLRGHGGTITSIAVHPISPHICCTTSKDFTTRIYDLTRLATEPSTDLHWAPDPRPSGAGRPFGLRGVEPEGLGRGLCIIVLVGGRSGGHRAAVLGAAFHPVLPVLATCGADCALKICTSKIHQASIGSIVWLNHELLLSHCASPVFRRGEGKEAILNTGEGTLVIWEWLTANLFFPSKQAGFQQEVLRGSTSECQDSSSLKVIAEYAFEHQLKPNVIPRIHSSTRGEPQVSYTYPGSQVIRIVELATVKSRKKPILANSDKQALLQDTLERHLNIEPLSNLGSTQLSILPEEGSFHACAMNPDGDVVIGTGEGAIWIWHK